MPEELYNSHDYCTLAEELEKLKLENKELLSDKMYLINTAMDGGNTYHYAAHDIGYRDMERKIKALKADYDISNRELLVKQVEIDRLTAELARRDEIISRLKEDAEQLFNHPMFNQDYWTMCPYCDSTHHGIGNPLRHKDTCPVTLHRALMKELE